LVHSRDSSSNFPENHGEGYQRFSYEFKEEDGVGDSRKIMSLGIQGKYFGAPNKF
jgi:hypothetical protein